MTIEIINTGTELMLGRVLNTHQQWLCCQLADQGWVVTRQTAVADTGADIQEAVREALGRADVVITTGGLGPTSDDLTRDLIAALLGRKLRTDEAVLRHIEEFFQRRRRPQPASTRVQAEVPEGATVLGNANGTAPGLILEVEAGRFRRGPTPGWLIMLPGPPRELRPMFSQQVLPWLRTEFGAGGGFRARTFKTTGIGESQLEELIAPTLKAFVDAGLELGFCARIGEVEVRLAARGGEAESLVDRAGVALRERLGVLIYGEETASLEETVIRLLTVGQRTLVVAESCTGGFLSHRLTNVPGASAVFLGGLVTYGNALKQSLLGVREVTLQEHGAVSRPVAEEMAEGARRRFGADYALSITGIAGPGGGSELKPVGTVHVGFSSAAETFALHFVNAYDRETFKFVTTQLALDLLRRKLQDAPEPVGPSWKK